MSDYIEHLIDAKKHLEKANDLLLHNRFSEAQEFVLSAETALVKLYAEVQAVVRNPPGFLRPGVPFDLSDWPEQSPPARKARQTAGQ